jgi:hypothetical protein
MTPSPHIGISSERVPNKPLSGTELIEITCRDVREVMQRDGMFSEYMAYGRVAYTVTIRYHLANPINPEHEVKVRPKPRPGEEAIEGAPPLRDIDGEDAVIAIERYREIVSPNAARIANNLPITVVTHQDGKMVTRQVKYDPGMVPPQPAPVDRDLSDMATQSIRKSRVKEVVAKR